MSVLAAVTLTDDTIDGNLVDGGVGGAAGGNLGLGGNGGDGGLAQGGGIFVAMFSTVALSGGQIEQNVADGGVGGLGGLGGTNGATGQGVGGGVYLSSTGSTESGTKITGNKASTSHNNIFGSFGS